MSANTAFSLRSLSEVHGALLLPAAEARSAAPRLPFSPSADNMPVSYSQTAGKASSGHARLPLPASLPGSMFFSDLYSHLLLGDVDHRLQQLVLQTSLMQLLLQPLHLRRHL